MKRKYFFSAIVLLGTVLLLGCLDSKEKKELQAQNKTLAAELQQVRTLADEQGKILHAVLINMESVQSEEALKGFQIEELTEILTNIQAIAGEKSKQIRNLQTRVRDTEKKAAREKQIHDKLVKELESMVKAGQAEILRLSGKTRIRLAENVLFRSGEAQLVQSGELALQKIGEQLKQLKDRRIMIEGHTDSVLIGKKLKSVYASNLELSAARAVAVHQFLRSKTKIPEKQLAVVALGPYQPIADNKTDAGRKKNRRVALVLEPLDTE